MLSLKLTASKKGPGFITFQEMKDQLKALKQDFPTMATGDLFEFCEKFLLERIRLNTPIRTGRLRDSIYVLRGFRGSKIQVSFRSDLPYALTAHEVDRELGPKSKEQPMQPEGGVGSKFIERCIDYHNEAIVALLRRVPENILVQKRFKSGAVRTVREVY